MEVIKILKTAIEIDGKQYPMLIGDEAIWAPINEEYGYKIILNASKKIYDNCKYIQKINSDIFPTIYDLHYQELGKTDELVVKDQTTQTTKSFYIPSCQCLIIKCANIARAGVSDSNKTICAKELIKHELYSEDTWEKYNPSIKHQEKHGVISGENRCQCAQCQKNLTSSNCNMYGKVIIDFHGFEHRPDRYKFPVKCSSEELDKIYKNALKRYKARGDNKWKGTIYQGMHFSNGYTMPGYSSDGEVYDSYKKFLFSYLHKAKNKTVLELGSNEGFFTFQCAMAGATHIDSVEMCPEDVQLAKEIQQVLDFDVPVTWYNNDITEFVEKSKNKYDVVFLHSVLHQMYPHFGRYDPVYKNKECKFTKFDHFINKVKKIANRVVVETPVNHPKMKLNERKVIKIFQRHFRDSQGYRVRKIYTYDAYSQGERLILTAHPANDANKWEDWGGKHVRPW